MARKTKEEAEKTRQALLKAALDVFFTRGVGRASLQEIAAQAGVTRGAVYWHFKDKAELLKTLADETFLPHEDLLDRLVADESANPLEALHVACVESMASIANDPVKRCVFTILLKRCEYVDEMRVLTERNEDCRLRMRDRLIGVFHKIEKARRLARPWIPQTAAAALQALFFGFINMEMESAAPDRLRDALYHSVLDAFFASIDAQNAATAVQKQLA
jgi:AcrR family transcriptional regulator